MSSIRFKWAFLPIGIKKTVDGHAGNNLSCFELILSNQKKTSGIVFQGKNTSQTCYRDVTLKQIRIKSDSDKIVKVRFNSTS